MTDPVSSFTENDTLTRSMTDPVSSFTENDSLTRSITNPVSSFTKNVNSYHRDVHILLSEGEKESGKGVEMKKPLHSIFPATTEREMIIIESDVDNFISRYPKLENDIAGMPLYSMSSDFFSGKTKEDHIKSEELNAAEMDENDQITLPQRHEVQKNEINKTSRKSELNDLREATMKTPDTSSNEFRITKIRSKGANAKSVYNQCMRSSVRNQQSVKHQWSMKHQRSIRDQRSMEHQWSVRHQGPVINQLPMYNLFHKGNNEKKLDNLISGANKMKRNSGKRQKRENWNHVEDLRDLNIARKDSGYNTPCWKCFKKSVFCLDDNTSIFQKTVKLEKRICEDRMTELNKGVIVIVDGNDRKTETSEKNLVKWSRRTNQNFDSKDIGGMNKPCVYQVQTVEGDEIDYSSKCQMVYNSKAKSESFQDSKSSNKGTSSSNFRIPMKCLGKSPSNLGVRGSTTSHVKSVYDREEVVTTRKADPQSTNEITTIFHNTNKLATASPVNQTVMPSKSKKNIDHEVGEPNLIEHLISDDVNVDYRFNSNDVNSENSENKGSRKNGNKSKSQKNSNSFDTKQKESFQCWLCFQKFKHCLEIKNHILDGHSSDLWAIFEDLHAKPPLILFCPNNCKYSTFKSEELDRHIATCQKLGLYNEEKPLFDVYNFISQEYVKLQQKISSVAIVNKTIRQKTCSQGRRDKSDIQHDFTNNVLIENEENGINEMCLEKNTEDLTLPSHQNIQTNGQEVIVTERHLKVLHKCHRCSLAFSSTLLLEKHLQRQHTEERPIVRKRKDIRDKIFFDKNVTVTSRRDLFRCDECEKVFTHSSQFCEHISIDSGKKTFQCKECIKTFYQISNYNDHMKIHKHNKLKMYKCKKCSQRFNDKGHLHEHMRTHKADKPFKCYKCGWIFCTKSLFQRHLKMHTGKKACICHQCGKCLIDKRNLEIHMRLHTGEKPSNCNECGQNFRHKGTLQIHMRRHTGEKPFKCNWCEKNFLSSSHLQTHLRTHTGEKPFECNQCGKDFLSSSNLTNHMRLHTGEKPFKCNECGQTFNQKGTLKRHMTIHTGDKPFKCNECGQTFNQRGNLKQHMRIHTGDKPFKCNECGQNFRQKGTLQSHMRTHTGEKPFKCNRFGENFLTSSLLQSHMKTHTGEKPFKCNECGKTFNQKGTLKLHMRIHTGDKPFKCNECGQNFRQKGTLQSHMRTHTGEKPFKCNECGKTFNQKGTLKLHMRIYTGGKPFKCNQCGKDFLSSSNLTNHMRLHTGEKPFKCNECGQTFNQKGTLKQHMRRHTGEKPFKCNECGQTFRHNCSLQRHMKRHTGEKAIQM